MNRLAALLLSATLLAAPIANATTLKPIGSVAAAQITLGDLFDGLPEDVASRTLMAAPAPGSSMTLDAGMLARIAGANGITWRPISPYDNVQLKREAVEVSTAGIQDALRAALIQAGTGADVDIQLDNRTLSLFLPVGSDASVRVENLAYEPARGRLTADLVAPASGPELLRQTVTGRAIDMVELPVLNRRLQTGEIIGEGDLTYLRAPRDRLIAGAVTDSADLVGKTLRRTVTPNQAVNSRDVREPVLVAKGAMVTIMLQSDLMTLTTQGRSLADGSQGELVRIVNTSSSRVIEAIVAGPNLVTVRPAGQIAAANQSAARPVNARASR